MNFISRTITGILTMMLGIVLSVAAFFTSLILLFYGIPIFILGIFIFFNKGEDKIEGIKKVK